MRDRALGAIAVACFGTLLATPFAELRSGLDLSTLDRGVRPQDDLYRFANGGWLDRTRIPPDRVTYGTFAELAERTEADLRQIIEQLPGRNRTERQIRDLYTSVIDERRLEDIGVRSLRPVLDRIDAIDGPQALAAEAGRLSAEGGGGPFQASAGLDAHDPSRIVIHLTQGGTLLPDREYYLSIDPDTAAIRQRYVHYLAALFRLTGRREPEAEARDVLELETALARAQDPQAGSRVSLAHAAVFTLRELHERLPGFDWTAWARPQGLDRASSIVVGQPDFFRVFAESARTTPLRTWKAWLAGRYITAVAPYSMPAISNARFEFFGRVLTGQEAPRARWKQGVALVSTHMGDALGRLYAEKYFPEPARKRIETLVQNLLEGFRQAITESDWMAPATRQHAIAKLAGLRTGIGYPSRWRDYSGLEVKPNDLMGNVERAQRFENAYQTRRLGRTEPDGWIVTPQTVNAIYLPWRNEVLLPTAILQAPLFDPAADDAVNYGALGAVVGHEIVHAFDQQGRRLDGAGNPLDWWTPADSEAFSQRTRLLVAQFNGYDAGRNGRLDGNVTLAENVGDLGGLALAVRAYRISLGDQASPVIDGFTGEQRLFVRWAQLWRTAIRDEYLRQTVLVGHHAPGRHRANGAAINLDAYHSAFGVQPGDKLFVDPRKRVRLW